METKEEIIKEIMNMSGKYPPTIIFSDWVHVMSIAIQNNCCSHNEIWKQREKDYKDLCARYETKEIKTFSKMLAKLSIALEKDMTDILGSIYMEIGSGSKQTGQFFTPYHISKLCSEMIENSNEMKVNEPSCGSGGMIIAMAQTLKEKNINFQKVMDVVAQDLDWRSVHMTYVQLSLLGIKAVVIQGNALDLENMKRLDKARIFYTPKKAGMIL